MDIDKTIEYLSMVNNVVPDYSGGRNKGLTDDDTERFTMQAIVNAITFLEKYRTSMALNVELDEMVDVLNQRIMTKRKEPCKWRYRGVCRHGGSKWYNNRVTGDKKERCQECEKYEK